MGLYMLGVDNVDRFFELVSDRSSSGRIDLSDGLDDKEKKQIKERFIGLLGEHGKTLFDGNPASFSLREGKTSDDIKRLLVSGGLYHEGEVPPVRYEELQSKLSSGHIGHPHAIS